MMNVEKKTYYVNLGHGLISQVKSVDSYDYVIQANDDEIVTLREYFDQNYSSDWQGFWRAHVPYLEYHHDKQNDAYDDGLQKILQLVYELGDEETRAHIKDNHLMEARLED
ncbi:MULTISPECIES: hydrolase [Bacillus]|uniref:hydrolase n=1 Tax=Bacillus TaxID=1386 RepID=UPI000BB6BE5E|nr:MULTISPECIES: hydrolase [Bacillus]